MRLASLKKKKQKKNPSRGRFAPTSWVASLRSPILSPPFLIQIRPTFPLFFACYFRRPFNPSTTKFLIILNCSAIQKATLWLNQKNKKKINLLFIKNWDLICPYV